MKKSFLMTLCILMVCLLLADIASAAANPIHEIFPNRNVSGTQNGLFATVAREFAAESIRRQNPMGMDAAHRVSQAEQSLSDDLMRRLAAAYEQDPIAQMIFGIDSHGMRLFLDGITVRAFVRMPDEVRGRWRAAEREVRFATHTYENGRLIPRDETEIVHSLLYELSGRAFGQSIMASGWKAEVLMGISPLERRSDWINYTGFLHALSDLVGAETLSSWLKSAQDTTNEQINAHIRLLNPNFTFTYEQLLMATLGAGAVVRNQNDLQRFSNQIGISENEVWRLLETLWEHFYNAINTNIPANQRTQYAQQFCNYVRWLAVFATHTAHSWHDGLALEGCDSYRPFIYLNNLGVGVHSQFIFQRGRPVSARPPGAIFPEVQITLGSLGRTLRFRIGSSTFTDNGIPHILEAAPFIASDRTMVPLRVIVEAFGATGLALNQGIVSFVLGGETITMTIGQPLPNNMGTPVIVAGRTFVPLAYIIDKIGAQARWDGSARAVYINIRP